jgi:hypothetical protein
MQNGAKKMEWSIQMPKEKVMAKVIAQVMVD